MVMVRLSAYMFGWDSGSCSCYALGSDCGRSSRWY
jgi:hypothetical protein